MEKVNVGGTENVIAAIKAAPRPPKLIHLSSVVAVGASRTPRALNEDAPYDVGPLDLGYFETKRAAEKLVLASGLPTVILKSVHDLRRRRRPQGQSKTQLKVARGELPVYTGGGVSVVSVHDVVDAIDCRATRGRLGERYILSGENITIKDLFERIARAAGQTPPRVRLPNAVVSRALGYFSATVWRNSAKKVRSTAKPPGPPACSTGSITPKRGANSTFTPGPPTTPSPRASAG